MPALNIPPTTSQELRVTAMAIAHRNTELYFFIKVFWTHYAKALPS